MFDTRIKCNFIPAFLLLSLMFLQVSGASLSVNVSDLSSVTRVFQVNVVFVGYSPATVNSTLIDANINKNCSSTYGNFTMEYVFNLNYYFANSSYHDSLRDVILDSSVNGTGTTSALNTTALQIQRNTNVKQSIFVGQSGRAIDAIAVEAWLEANPGVSSSAPAYWFYVLNFTEFDSPSHSLEHWYNATEIDSEAGHERDFWRLEWDNALNPNVRFPYAAFTSQSRIMLIDPSAFQWYLTWARIWWWLDVSGPKYDYYYEDLDQFSVTHNLNTTDGKTSLAYYLAGWIEDPLRNLLEPQIWDDVGIFTAKSLSIQTLILNNASEAGYTNDQMAWFINTTTVAESISDLAPLITANVSVDFKNLSDYPDIKAFLDTSVLFRQNGITYYDGELIWNYLYNVRGSYFNMEAGDIVITAWVLLEGNMSMWYGGEYTGLGGGGQVLVMKSVERYFETDGITPKSGLGAVLIHEAGHNLGFDHTFTHGMAYAGDFAFDVMGYYPYAYQFSLMRKDSWRRLIDDYGVMQVQERLSGDEQAYNRKPQQPSINARFTDVQTALSEADQSYNALQFLEAHDKIDYSATHERQLNSVVWTYLCDINIDGYVNAKDAVKLGAVFGSQEGNPPYNPSADINGDRTINAKDAVLLGSHFSELWS